jgi:hypothetical protein
MTYDIICLELVHYQLKIKIRSYQKPNIFFLYALLVSCFSFSLRRILLQGLFPWFAFFGRRALRFMWRTGCRSNGLRLGLSKDVGYAADIELTALTEGDNNERL